MPYEDERSVIELNDVGKCCNCKVNKVTLFAIVSEHLDDDEIPNTEKYCCYCMLSRFVDEDWILAER